MTLTRAILFRSGRVAMSGDILSCRNVGGTESGGVTGIQKIETRNVAKQPAMHRTAPQSIMWPQMSTVPRVRNILW